MPKRAKELSAVEVRRIQKPGLHAVGGVAGLHLRVTATGASTWILRAKLGSKRRDFGLGPYPDVSLGQARERARELKDQIWQGRDPIAERQAAKAELQAQQARELTFAEAARKCHQAKVPEFKNAHSAKIWLTRLENHAFPVIGHINVHEIDLALVRKVLDPIWLEKPETASRVRQYMEAVLTWAMVSGYREGENPARWQGNLKEVMPNPRKTHKVQHQPALPWDQAPAFLVEVRKQNGIGARALEFIIYTAARSGEVRGARWEEVDFEQRLWTIPGDRMKGGKPHQVPLNDAAVGLLQKQAHITEGPWLFTAPRGGVISDATISKVTKKLGWKEPSSGRVIVPHGMRSTFKDWARNCTSYSDEVSELQLAHVHDSATRAAYARDGLLEQRRQLMAQWACFLRCSADANMP
ncbi:tyrosine-type recombinase/integrase [Halorhodospira halochloris]|uniref:tyrosine-type recombinase/integrase n=1 Tax=Halorhodospira halochloris TaxID=1052 RepID=UPI001EE7D350|nr:site-specific integrase [Halorhodospira halochloris]MCG5547540.1 integrase arm-type DNA-binding domain-containing protein [Halorhodospira halochloris]